MFFFWEKLPSEADTLICDAPRTMRVIKELTNIIFPGFTLPPDAGEKLTLGKIFIFMKIFVLTPLYISNEVDTKTECLLFSSEIII